MDQLGREKERGNAAATNRGRAVLEDELECVRQSDGMRWASAYFDRRQGVGISRGRESCKGKKGRRAQSVGSGGAHHHALGSVVCVPMPP